MRTETRTVVASLALLLLAPAASAGPPLVCHRYIVEGAPQAPLVPTHGEDGALRSDLEDAVMMRLDGEAETLVRMQILQDTLLALSGTDRIGGFLERLERRARAASQVPAGAASASACARRFDFALAGETAKFVGHGSIERDAEALVAAAKDVKDDAAVCVAMARAVTPLMRTGSSQEHARMFLAARDLAARMPDGPAKERLDRVLAYDLDHLEAYLLDRELIAAGNEKPDAEARLAALRRLAEQEKQ